MTQLSFSSIPPHSIPQFEGQEDRRASSAGLSHVRAHLPDPAFLQFQQQGFHQAPNRIENSIYQVPQTAIPSLQSQLGQARNLSNLVEAALTPQHFTPVENTNPTLWDGFMGFDNNASSFMGSHDADISWTLNPLEGRSSSSHNSDQELIQAFEEFSEAPFSYPTQQPLQSSSPVDTGDNEDVESDWPDKISRADAYRRRASRMVPQLTQFTWQPVVHEARANQLSLSSTNPSTQRINDALRDTLISALNGAGHPSTFTRAEISNHMFPPAEVLEHFLRLYIKHIQPRFPILHIPTFNLYFCPPLLLIAMMFLGSSHSGSDRGRFSRMFHGHLRIACIRMQEIDWQFVGNPVLPELRKSNILQLRSTDNMLTHFLLCLSGTWSGSKEAYEFAEGARGVLVTACRRMRLLDQRPSANLDTERFLRVGLGPLESTWRAWAETEKKKRLGLSIYVGIPI